MPLNSLRAEARAVVPGCLRKTLKNKKGKKEGKEGGKEERARIITLRLSSSMTLSKLINHPETNFLRFIGRD